MAGARGVMLVNTTPARSRFPHGCVSGAVDAGRQTRFAPRMTLRLAFMGSPDFAVPTLTALVAAGHDIACVYSQPPRPAGRGQSEHPTPVAAFAAARGLLTRTPRSLRGADAQAAFAALDLDAAVVAAYGLILPQPILDAPRLGCFNLHGSLLPRWRGAAPIQRAIMAGDAVTGVQVMRMTAGLDEGPICLSEMIAIRADDTARTLQDRMAQTGAVLMVEAMAALERGVLRSAPQDPDGVTYAGKIDKAEARIDWTQPAAIVDRRIRALSPAPGAWFRLPDGQGGVRVKALMSRLEPGAGAPGEVLDDALLVACGEGAVRLITVQREGKAVMAARDMLRGSPAAPGLRLD
jgi:methionyl-tRNA formyltransferase